VGIIPIILVMAYSFWISQLLLGIIIFLIIGTFIVARAIISDQKLTEELNQEEIVVQVRADSNIFKVPSYFVGIPFFIVFGEMGSKYESIFSVENEDEEITVVYPGICSVSKNDEVAISGIMVSDKKGNIVRKCMKASSVEKIPH
jgi:uncharacterized protein YneF (UPF0154 family)